MDALCLYLSFELIEHKCIIFLSFSCFALFSDDSCSQSTYVILSSSLHRSKILPCACWRPTDMHVVSNSHEANFVCHGQWYWISSFRESSDINEPWGFLRSSRIGSISSRRKETAGVKSTCVKEQLAPALGQTPIGIYMSIVCLDSSVVQALVWITSI